MKETKVKIAFALIRNEIHDAWERGQRELDIRLGDIHKKLGWKNNLHTVGEALVRMYQIFDDEGEKYQCSCEIIHFPEWKSNLTNIYGSNLVMKFKFPSPQIDIHELIFNDYDKFYKKMIETQIVLNRCTYEMFKMLKTLENGEDIEDFNEKFSKCQNTSSEYSEKYDFQIQKLHEKTKRLLEQLKLRKSEVNS